MPDDLAAPPVTVAPRPSIIKVAIIEDRRDIREGLAVLVNGTEGYRCTGAFRSMESALENIGRDLPHLALVDIGLPGMSGIEGIRALGDRYPGLLMLVLTVYNDDERIFEALCAGACGYLLKNTLPARLLASLEEAVMGGSPMSPQIARRVVTLFRDTRPPETPASQLTPHETRLLKLLVEGHSYKSAAKELRVSVHAISFHMRSIYDKLQVHSKSEAVSKAFRHRLIR
jgi:DNA-binding NarL/FixJ family response regulator